MIEISENSFSASRTQNNTLSIRFLPDGFCFAVFDEEERLIHFTLEKGRPNVSLDGYELLRKPYSRVFYCCDSSRYTLIPNTVFKQDDQSYYWKLNFGESISSEGIDCNMVRLTDIVNLFGYERELLAEIQRIQPAARLIHRQSVQICRAVMTNKQTNKRQFFLHVLPEEFDVVLVEKGNVQLANTFFYHNDDEFLYFVLNIFDQLRLDQYTTELIAGGVLEEDAKIPMLRKYISNVNVDNSTLRELSSSFNKINECKLQYTLLNLPMMVL